MFIEPREKQFVALLEKKNVSTSKTVLAARQAKAMLTPVGRGIGAVARSPILHVAATMAGVTTLAGGVFSGAYGLTFLFSMGASFLGMIITGLALEKEKLAHRFMATTLCSLVGLIGSAAIGGEPNRAKLEETAAQTALKVVLGGQEKNSASYKERDFIAGGVVQGTVEVERVCDGKDADGDPLKLLNIKGEETAYVLKKNPDGSTSWEALERSKFKPSKFNPDTCSLRE